MWSRCLYGALLLALVGEISVLNAQSQDIQVGGYFTLNSLTYTTSLTKCYVVSPANETIEFIPSNLSDDRFELQEPREPFGCSVWVRNVTATDTGIWTIYSEAEDGRQFRSTSYVSVIGENGSDIFEEDDENITWLTDIDYLTTFGNNITITLSKLENDETCFLRSNQGRRIELSEDANGIRAYGPSEYVSCRVVVGPFDGTMIGTWTLCGQSMNGEEEIVRCQRAKVAWHNNSPNSSPNPITEPELKYVVNYGMTLYPGVRGTGEVYSCHVITPSGEDIALSFNSTYPKLARLGLNALSTCSVAIGPIDEAMIGDWRLYAVFTSSFMGNSKKYQPLHFYLYDESNPEAQAYNVTTLDLQNSLVNLGNTEMFQVTGSGQIDNCIIKTPTGEQYDLASDVGIQGLKLENDITTTACHVTIGPITEDMLGEWELSGKFSSNGIFTERRLPFQIIKEDPANPIDDGVQRRIEYLDEEIVYMDLGATHRFIIPKAGSIFTTYDSCHLETPHGLQYKLMEGFNVSGVEIVEDEHVACGVNITVVDDSNVGSWKLFSRETVIGTPTEKRFHVDIKVEVEVNSSAKEVTIAKGNDLHISLQNPTNLSKTCILTRPDGSTVREHELNVDSDNCEFVVSDMKIDESGTWTIIYGNGVIYKAKTEVNVVGRSEIDVTPLTWIRDQPVNITVGPDDAVYCRLISPDGSVVFDNFGRCMITTARATTVEHAGKWRMTVGLPGRILTEEMDFTVHVVQPASKAKVSVEVVRHNDNGDVELNCSLATEEEVLGCKFRDPSGKVLLASHGVGEDRYRFYSATGGTVVESSVSAHECRLSISNPLVEELGSWRCAMTTATDTYYGFLTVKSLHPEFETNIVTEPTLASDGDVSSAAGDAATLACSVSAPIRYCYFRASNGTVYNVAPGSVGDVQYAGAGFDAGDCAAHFSSLLATDSGTWSCHVGLLDSTEQRAQLYVNIYDEISVTQSLQGDTLLIHSHVSDFNELEYCRFVRSDGVGFTSDNVPPPYISDSSLENGACGLQIPNPSVLELQPWTVVAKVTGRDVEYSTVTETVSPPAGIVGVRKSSFIMFPFLLVCIPLSIVFIGMLLGPKNNRRWTYSRVSIIRNSIRRSMRKVPPPPYAACENITKPVSA